MKTFVLMEMVYGFPPKPNMITFTAKNEDTILKSFFFQPLLFDVEFFTDLFEKYLNFRIDEEDTEENEPNEGEIELYDMISYADGPINLEDFETVFSNLKLVDIIKYINSKFYDKEDPYYNLFLVDNRKPNIHKDLIHTPVKNKKSNSTSAKVNLNTAVPIRVNKITDLFNS